MKTLSLLVVLSIFLTVSCQRQASVREEPVTLKTYPFGDPDPVPHPEKPDYPYFHFDGYAHNGKDSAWNAVVMENPYVKVTIIPGIGGKIWGAVEKSTGMEFIYFNHSAKFRNVAMRGPWTSGGIEANFGIIGHAPTTSTPVDYYTRTNDDGSVSCFIGALELVTRTWWQVEVNLPKDKAFFTTRTVWYNTTPLTKPYYQWMNAGYKAADDLELYFPGHYYIGHGGDAHPWPIDAEGRDLSKYAQNNFGGPKSYHVIGNLNDFYAAYYKDSHFGSAHYAPYGEKEGMKVWIWGLSQQGMIWENLLTDIDGQYVELQSGRLYNQAASESNHTPFKQLAFEPYASDTWTEYWFPVKETGGIAKANAYGALNVTKKEGSATIDFCPVQKIDDELVVTVDGKEVFRKHLSLDVMQIWHETVALDHSAVVLRVSLGNRLLEYSDDPADNHLARPVTTPQGFNRNSAYGLYMQGQQEMYRNQLTAAEKLLNQSLALEPHLVPALNDLANIYYQRGCFVEADSCARIVLSINTYDPDGNLIYGLANSRLGNPADARDGFLVAALTPSHRAAAYVCLATESAREQHWADVVQYAGKALAAGGNNADVQQLRALAYRRKGQPEKAETITEQIEKSMPLNHYARFERYMLTRSEKDKIVFLQYIRNELPHETFMEMAGWYESAVCTDEALMLYSFAPDYPMAAYRAAYLLFQRGDTGWKAMLERAESLPTHMVFPFRTESLPALEWAVQQSDKWVGKYYLGILYAFLGQDSKASGLLEQCGNASGEASFYLARSKYRQCEKQLDDLLRAEEFNNPWRAGMALIRYYQHTGQYAAMYDCAAKYASLYPANDALGLKYAAAMLYRGQYRQCVDYLAGLDVLPNEGAHEGRRLYRDAWLFLALQHIKSGDYRAALSQIDSSKLWPENLGVGKPYDDDIDLRSEDFMTAYCYEKLKDTENAAIYYDKVKPGKDHNSNELLVAFSLRRDNNKLIAGEAIACDTNRKDMYYGVVKEIMLICR